jgi:hypothetical protein
MKSRKGWEMKACKSQGRKGVEQEGVVYIYRKHVSDQVFLF